MNETEYTITVQDILDQLYYLDFNDFKYIYAEGVKYPITDEIDILTSFSNDKEKAARFGCMLKYCLWPTTIPGSPDPINKPSHTPDPINDPPRYIIRNDKDIPTFSDWVKYIRSMSA